MKLPRYGNVLVAAAFLAGGSGAAIASEHTDEALKKRITDLETQVDDLKKATERNKLHTISMQHLAGYGDVTYTSNLDEDEGAFTRALFAPIFHYQYDDLLLFEGELEFEIEDSGETEVALEYVTVDLLINDYMALVAGKFLSPIGQFRQNVHPSWINKLPSAPVGFGHGGAAPLSDLGAQLRGGFPIAGKARANYALFVANGPSIKAELHEEDGETEIEGIELESEGFATDPDGKKVFGGRIGVLPIPALELGLSGGFGQVGTATAAGEEGELEFTPTDERDYSVIGADALFNWRNLQLRGEYIRQKVESATVEGIEDDVEGVDSLAEELEFTAWYVQAAYKIPSTKFEGVARFGDVDVPGDQRDRSQWAVGLNYLFTGNVIAKVAVELDDFDAGDRDDEERVVLQLAYGF